jgi:TetR/AcrR family transcriptional repressor of bet genes
MSNKVIAFERKTSEQRRQDLIDAGIRCLGEGGISSFTIDKICKQAQVSRGLINHHFQSKNELLLCIYDSMTGYLVEDDSSLTAREQIVSIVEKSFDANSFEKSNLRAWLAIWGEVATHSKLKQLHESRYRLYKQKLIVAINAIAAEQGLNLDANAIARQLIALIDGLWLEYCLHSEGFSLEAARHDCYQFLQAQLGALTLRYPH